MKKLIGRFEEMGIRTWVLSNLRLKDIASRCGLRQGLNTLHYHRALGSKFCMELIGLDVVPAGENETPEQATLSCESCKRCMSACPGGAITANGFVKEKCIRFYMIGGKSMPLHLRNFVGGSGGSYAMIGCDVCQRVCPANQNIEKLRGMEKETDFTLEELLLCSDETLERFGEMYGRNYAVRNRVIAQALLAAGNSGNEAYLPLIVAYKDSASPIVREYAAWAEEKMKNLQKIY
ncbi:MAG: epoxyqueuosine reductase [Clostridia bacterium]|nr:epoxyqueuosine reductase [Clostridia bacterium]